MKTHNDNKLIIETYAKSLLEANMSEIVDQMNHIVCVLKLDEGEKNALESILSRYMEEEADFGDPYTERSTHLANIWKKITNFYGDE